uniref:Uncharacterized protein n=1 Tax=Sus scrofa TaxID=9823 RepID=A0A4X1VIQ9_PIG
ATNGTKSCHSMTTRKIHSLEVIRWAGHGGTCLQSQLLGRLRLEDRLSPGVLGCSALC